MEKQRIAWVDYAKGLSMCLVILFHTHGPQVIQPLACIPKLAVFFFMAGMFAHPEKHTGWGHFFRHKTLRLLIPYICFNIVTYLFWLFVSSRFGADAGNNPAWWEPFYGMLYGTSPTLIHYAPLWFLPCLMVTELLFYIVFRYTHGYWSALCVLTIAGGGCLYSHLHNVLLPWGIGSAMVMLPLYSAGYLLANKTITISTQSKWWHQALVFVLSTTVVMLMYKLNGYARVSTVSLGNCAYAYIAFISTITMILSLAMMMERFPGYHFPFLTFIGQNTLIYLCLHIMLFTLIKGICVFVFHLPLTVFSTATGCIGLTLGTMIMGILLVWGIKKYVPFIIGKF